MCNSTAYLPCNRHHFSLLFQHKRHPFLPTFGTSAAVISGNGNIWISWCSELLLTASVANCCSLQPAGLPFGQVRGSGPYHHHHHHHGEDGSRPSVASISEKYIWNHNFKLHTIILKYYGFRCHGDLICNHITLLDLTRICLDGF